MYICVQAWRRVACPQPGRRQLVGVICARSSLPRPPAPPRMLTAKRRRRMKTDKAQSFEAPTSTCDMGAGRPAGVVFHPLICRGTWPDRSHPCRRPQCRRAFYTHTRTPRAPGNIDFFLLALLADGSEAIYPGPARQRRLPWTTAARSLGSRRLQR